MEYVEMSCAAYVKALSSGQPVPGGGGASAMAAAIGVASGNMMCRLTLGKKKYAAVQASFEKLARQAVQLEDRLLGLVTRDADAFTVLLRAYALPEGSPQKAEALEAALRGACAVPLETMHCCCEAIVLQKAFAEGGTANALSEASVGVGLCRGALQGAAASVFINTKLMQDRAYADTVNQQAQAMLDEYLPLADAVYDGLNARLRRTR